MQHRASDEACLVEEVAESLDKALSTLRTQDNNELVGRKKAVAMEPGKNLGVAVSEYKPPASSSSGKP